MIGLCVNCLQGCKTCSNEVEVRTEFIKPPQSLLIPCHKPELEQMKTNQDLIKYTSDLLYEFDLCSSRMDSLILYFGERDE